MKPLLNRIKAIIMEKYSYLMTLVVCVILAVLPVSLSGKKYPQTDQIVFVSFSTSPSGWGIKNDKMILSLDFQHNID